MAEAGLRKILRNQIVVSIVCSLVSGYIKLVSLTGRWDRRGFEKVEAHLALGKPVIGAFWHGRMMLLPAFWSYEPKLAMLISNHRDGEIIARAIDKLGFVTVRGSAAKKSVDGSSKAKGGATAVRALLKCLEENVSVAVTPDGPRGPRMRASMGVVTLAKMSGIPIFPATWSAKRRKIFSSWDRFVFVLPFSRGVWMVGEPIHVASDADDRALEDARENLEKQLNTLTMESDRLMGRDVVQPAPILSKTAAGG